MDLSDAILKIDKLKRSNATQIAYEVIIDFFCSESDLQRVFEKGSIADLTDVFVFGCYSVGDDNNVWHCIKLSTKSKEALIYTSGTSDVLYFSIL